MQTPTGPAGGGTGRRRAPARWGPTAAPPSGGSRRGRRRRSPRDASGKGLVSVAAPRTAAAPAEPPPGRAEPAARAAPRPGPAPPGTGNGRAGIARSELPRCSVLAGAHGQAANIARFAGKGVRAAAVRVGVLGSVLPGNAVSESGLLRRRETWSFWSGSSTDLGA